MNYSSKLILFIPLLLTFLSVLSYAQDPGSYLAVNCGNAGEPNNQARQAANMASLNLASDLGIGWARCSGGHQQWYNGGSPSPERFDPVITKANQLGIKVYLFLEYREDIDGLNIDAFDWELTGKKFAEYYGDRVACYGIMNEVDHDWSPHTPEEVYSAVSAFALGVKSVDSSLLLISPSMGGTPMSPGEEIPFLQILSPLFNNGTIDILNLHSYHDCRPNVHYSCIDYTGSEWAPHRNFLKHKKDGGITANVKFAAGEFNYRNWQGSDEDRGIGFMTTLWSQLSVVGNEGADDRVGQFSLPFNLTDSRSQRQTSMCDHWEYNNDGSEYTWIPNEKGKIVQENLKLTRGMEFVRTDPLDKGLMILRGANQKAWIWQNRAEFSSLHNQKVVEISGIPVDASSLAIYKWDSSADRPAQFIPLAGSSSQIIDSGIFPKDQTIILIANSSGDPTQIGDISVSDATPLPNAPDLFSAQSVTGEYIVLEWKDQSNLEDGYILERSVDKDNFLTLDTLMANTTEFRDSSVLLFNRYYYRLRAYNGQGNSAFSPIVSDSTGLASVPPLGFQITTASNFEVEFNWEPTNYNEDGYELWRSANEQEFELYERLDKSIYTFTDQQLEKGIFYQYKLRTFNQFGYSDFTKVLSHQVENVPPPPSDLNGVSVQATFVDLEWTDRSDNEMAFVLERKNLIEFYRPLDTLPPNTTSFLDTTVSRNTTYLYRIKAINELGSSSYSNEIRVKTLTQNTTSTREVLVQKLLVYPNPSKGVIRIKEAITSSKDLRIYNYLGKLVYQKRVQGDEPIEVSFLPPGVYFVLLERWFDKLIISSE